MLIFGSKSTQLLPSEYTNEQCLKCKAESSIYMGIFQEYFHIFWIPIFPEKKTASTRCNKCGNVIQLDDFSGNLYEHYKILRSKRKTPIWTYTGVFLVLLYFILKNYVID